MNLTLQRDFSFRRWRFDGPERCADSAAANGPDADRAMPRCSAKQGRNSS